MTATAHLPTSLLLGQVTNRSLHADYYADLELPINASIEDVRKAYRKLALQYHPDRNAGREEECVPKFQAIQQANEVLGDAAIKQKYDIDRRKAGLYPSTQPTGFTPRQPTPGSTYTAPSAYPPPPRRTQPGTWQQRPPPAASSAAPNAAGATGADRFSNFPRPSHPTAKKDHAQERTNMFNAWQNMSTPQNRQPRFAAQPNAQQPPPQAQPQPQSQPQAARPRPPPPQPPPRPQANMPNEEQIRAGMKYRQPPPPPPAMDGLNERQKAWQSFEQNGPNKPGINRSNTTRTPQRQGFNPNAPGSDERAAPRTGAAHIHRNKSADFGRPRQFPQPQAGGAYPPGQMPTSPISPKVSPTSVRPGTDSSRPDRTQVPYSEANRKSTPYTNFIGEKTDFGSNLRRSYSTRDTSKLGPEDAANKSRARSSSPPRREPTATNKSGGKAPFVMYSSSSAATSSSDMAETQEENDSVTGKQRPGTAPDDSSNRPKRVPRPPSSRVNGHGTRSGPNSSVPPTPGASDINDHGMPTEGTQQKPKPSMYANPSPFDQKSWIAATFGSFSTTRAKPSRFKVPSWAIPGSVNPSLKREKPVMVESQPYTTAADRVYICARPEERQAYIRFQALLVEAFEHAPDSLDMTLFNTLIQHCRHDIPTGNAELDRVLMCLLAEFPSVGVRDFNSNHADQAAPPNSFTFPNAADLFKSSTHKSRSEEQINTKFSPDGWNGTFTGEPDYFANGTAKSRSPSRRPVSSRAASSQRRAATMDIPNSSTTSNAEGAQRPWGSDGQPKDVPPLSYTAPDGEGFSPGDWQKKFQESPWTMPPPPPNPPSPSKFGASAPGSRRPSKTLRPKKGQTFQSHVDGVTVELEDDGGKHDSAVPNTDNFDAMDIDDTPPAQRKSDPTAETSTQTAEKEKEARLYSVPPSAWRQQQEQTQHAPGHRKTSSASRRAERASTSSATAAKLNTNLDDLRNIEPISRTAGPAVGGGFSNMTSLGDDLPFQSASAKSIPPETLQKLDLPTVPTTPELPRRWSKLSWHMYAEHFADYLKRQHEFNKKMLSYFAVRLQSDEQLISTGNKAWLEASGVTQNGIGFDAYAQNVRKDEEMRAAWDIGCERHRKAIREFGESRERVRNLAQTGSLPE